MRSVWESDAGFPKVGRMLQANEGDCPCDCLQTIVAGLSVPRTLTFQITSPPVQFTRTPGTQDKVYFLSQFYCKG